MLIVDFGIAERRKCEKTLKHKPNKSFGTEQHVLYITVGYLGLTSAALCCRKNNTLLTCVSCIRCAQKNRM